MLNFLTNSAHPKLEFSTHQYARFCSNPKTSHEQAVKNIVRYLLSTLRCNEKGQHNLIQFEELILTPDVTQSIRCYADVGFAGKWNASWSEDAASALSRSGYIINYTGCPIIWSSKIQAYIALSMTESEYITLSQSMRDIIRLIDLLTKL